MTIFRKMYWKAMDKMAEKGCLDKLLYIVSDYMIAAGQDTLLLRVKPDSDICSCSTERVVLYADESGTLTENIRRAIDMIMDSLRSKRGL